MKFALLILSILLVLAGCDAPVGSFATNDVYLMSLAHSRDAETAEVKRDVSPIVQQLFGTPDEPRWPKDLADLGLSLDQENLSRAAGKVSSEEDGTHRGLFREHCVICHALPGSGAGPAALFQNPYPRDFRAGVYKWKSTRRDAKPTHDDLENLLRRGIPGTSMPSFALIDPQDIDALVDYVIYLSVRGEVERSLMATAIDDLDYGDGAIPEVNRLGLVLPTDSQQTMGQGRAGQAVVQNVLTEVTKQWTLATDAVIAVPAFEVLVGAGRDESIKRGEAIFHGQIANCVGCHGQNGAGGVPTLDFDDWTKEYSTRLGIDPQDRETLRPFKKAGALTPRLAKPRSLTHGVFRGGGDAEDLYCRITQGIAGTPMPAVRVVASEDGTGLTTKQVSDLIRYVQSIGDSPQ